MRWTLKSICYRHVETFVYKPSINSKIENIFCQSKLAIKNIWENPKYIMVLTKKKKKYLDQSGVSKIQRIKFEYQRLIFEFQRKKFEIQRLKLEIQRKSLNFKE